MSLPNAPALPMNDFTREPCLRYYEAGRAAARSGITERACPDYGTGPRNSWKRDSWLAGMRAARREKGEGGR